MMKRTLSVLLFATLAGTACTPDEAPTAPAGPQVLADEPAPAEAEPTPEPAAAPHRPTSFEPNTPEQEELRGLAFQALDAGDMNTAITALLALRDTAEASELRASGVLLLSELYNIEGQADRAIELLIGLRTSAPPMAELEFVLGRTYMESGHGDEAETALREAIRLDPGFLRSYLALGALLSQSDRGEDAAEVFVRYERQVQRMADVLESDASADEKLRVIDALGLSLPDDRLSRALGVALDDDALAIQAAAVAALAEVGTLEAIPGLRALRERTTTEQLQARIDEAIAMIESRG